jgi:hypothetical protein
VRVSDRASLATVADADREVDRWLGPLFVGIIFAFTSIAVVNTLAMIALQRRRELALLRLAGGTPGQVRSMARWEAALVIAMGLGLGLAIAATALLPLSHALTGTLRPHVPPGAARGDPRRVGAAGAARAGAADEEGAALAAGRGDGAARLDPPGPARTVRRWPRAGRGHRVPSRQGVRPAVPRHSARLQLGAPPATVKVPPTQPVRGALGQGPDRRAAARAEADAAAVRRPRAGGRIVLGHGRGGDRARVVEPAPEDERPALPAWRTR